MRSAVGGSRHGRHPHRWLGSMMCRGRGFRIPGTRRARYDAMGRRSASRVRPSGLLAIALQQDDVKATLLVRAGNCRSRPRTPMWSARILDINGEELIGRFKAVRRRSRQSPLQGACTLDTDAHHARARRSDPRRPPSRPPSGPIAATSHRRRRGLTPPTRAIVPPGPCRLASSAFREMLEMALLGAKVQYACCADRTRHGTSVRIVVALVLLTIPIDSHTANLPAPEPLSGDEANHDAGDHRHSPSPRTSADRHPAGSGTEAGRLRLDSSAAGRSQYHVDMIVQTCRATGRRRPHLHGSPAAPSY